MNVLTARAKRIDNGEWVEGYPIPFGDEIFMVGKGPQQVSEDIRPVYVAHCEAIKVDPATLGYETGKRDKNGEMIYGGMKVKYLKTGIIGDVVYFENAHIINFHDGNVGALWAYESKDLEIVKEGE